MNFSVLYSFLLIFRLEKQSDLAEQIESVAYIVCGDNKISSDKFYQIFVEKGVSFYKNFLPTLFLALFSKFCRFPTIALDKLEIRNFKPVCIHSIFPTSSFLLRRPYDRIICGIFGLRGELNIAQSSVQLGFKPQPDSASVNQYLTNTSQY